MFIPFANEYNKFKVGDIVFILKNRFIKGGMFTVGHEFKIINIKTKSKYKFYEEHKYEYKLMDLEHNIIITADNTEFAIRIDTYENAKNKNKQVIEYKSNLDKIQKILNRKCPHKEESYYDRRDFYDRCKLLPKHGCDDTCRPSLKCTEKYSDSDIKFILRKIKLNNIKHQK